MALLIIKQIGLDFLLPHIDVLLNALGQPVIVVWVLLV